MVPGSRRAEYGGGPESGSIPESVNHLRAIIQYLQAKLQDPNFDPRQPLPDDFPNPHNLTGNITDLLDMYVRVARVQTDNLPPAQEITKIQIEQNVLNKIDGLKARLEQRVEYLTGSDFGLDELDFADEEAWGLNLDAESDYEDEKYKFVHAIYDVLRDKYSPVEHRLPEWELLKEYPASEVMELITIALMNKVNSIYGDKGASAGTERMLPGKVVDLWEDDELFKEVTLHGTEDKSVKFFFTEFPWEIFLPEGTVTEARKIEVRSQMSDLWKYRLMCLSNMGNLAHKIVQLWKGKRGHGSFIDEVLPAIGDWDDGGGYMQWDMPNFHKRFHSGILAEIFATEESDLSEPVEEHSWLMGEYTNFFIHAIQYGNKKLTFALANTVAKLTSNKSKYIKEIRKKLRNKYGEEIGDKRFDRDRVMIDMAWNTALWTIIHTLVIVDMDNDALHTKLGRVINNKQYAPKILADTGNAKDRVRNTIAQQIEHAQVHRDRFIHVGVVLQTEDGEDIVEPHRIKFSSEETDSVYRDYVVEFARKSIGKYEKKIFEASDISYLEAELSAMEEELLQLADFTAQESADKVGAIESLSKQISRAGYKQGDSKGVIARKKKQKAELLRRQKELVKRIDLTKEIAYVKDLIQTLKNAVAEGEDVRYAAARYAIEQRYNVYMVKPKFANLQYDDLESLPPELRPLPLIIPKNQEYTPSDDAIYNGRKHAMVSLEDVRAAMLDTTFVDFRSMTQDPNYRYSAAMQDMRLWYKFGDLSQIENVFRDIHNPDLTKKIMAKVKLTKWKGEVQKFYIENWAKLPVANIRRLALQADEVFRSKITIGKISIDEIAVGEGAKGEEQTIKGINFSVITQYAGRYAAGKMRTAGATLPANAEEMASGKYSDQKEVGDIWLEVFREQVDDFDDLLREVAEAGEDEKKATLRKKMATPVVSNVRAAVDAFMEGNVKRWEKQIIVEAFWVALGAYLDQYAYKPLEDAEGQDIELTFMSVDRLRPYVKTVSNVKPMSFAERQLLISFVDKQLAYFASDRFAKGLDAPIEVGGYGDLIEMMKSRGIIGSTQQLIVDLDYVNNDFKKLKEHKKKE